MKALLNLFTLLLLAVSLTSCSTQGDKAQEYYAKAMNYIEQDKPDSAIIELRNALQQNPDYSEARYELGILYLKQGDPQKAFSELQKAAELDPQNQDANLKVAELYLIAKNTEGSRTYLQRVFELEPEDTSALLVLANLELLEGNLDAANLALEKISPDSRTDNYYSIAGRIHGTEGRYDESEKLLLKALEINPENLTHYRNLLLLYKNRGMADKANNLLDQISRLFGGNNQALLLTMQYYQAVKDYENAAKPMQQLIELEPDNPKHRLMLAELYKEAGQRDKAEELLIQAQLDIPDHPDIMATLADLKFTANEFGEAGQIVDTILEGHPNHPMGSFVQAKLLFIQGKPQEAVNQFTNLTKNYPRWSDPHHYLALVHLKSGYPEIAQQANNQAIQLSPANSKYRTLQSRIFLIQGDAENGGKEASIALQINPTNYAAAKLLAQALLQSKRFDEAIKAISEIIKQVPDDPDMLASLGLAYLGNREQSKGLETFTELIEKSPENSRALKIFASLTARGDNQKAIQLVQAHIAQHPDYPGHYLLLGELLANENEYQAAVDAFLKSQELAPDNPQPYIARGRLLHKLGNKEEAIAEFNTLLDKDPNSIPALMGLAAVYESLKEYDTSKKLYQQVLEIDPVQPMAANNLAYRLTNEEKSDLGEALRLAILAKQAMPDNPQISDTLGMVHLKRATPSLAIGQFEYALVERPDDPVIGYHLALAHQAAGNMQKAIDTLEKVTGADIDFDEKNEALQLLQQLKSEQLGEENGQ